MKRLLAFALPILLSIFSNNLSGQSRICDPLDVKEQLSIALEEATSEPSKSLAIINAIILEAEKESNRSCIQMAYIALGRFYFLNKQLDEALLSTNQAYLIAIDIGAELLIHESLVLLSEIHLAKDIKIESLEYLYKGLEVSQQLKDTSSISWFLIQIPEVEQEIGNIGQAMEYALKAKTFFEFSNNSKGLGNTMLNIGNIHIKLGNIAISRENLIRAQQLIQPTGDSLLLGRIKLAFSDLLLSEEKIVEAKRMCLQSLDLLKPSYSKEYLRAQSKLGEIATLNREFATAQEILVQTLKNQKLQKDVSGQAYTTLRLAKLYQANKQIELAISAYKESIIHSNEVGLNDLTRLAYKGLSQVLGGMSDYSNAFINLNHYTRITDSLFNVQKISEASKLEEKFNLEKHLQEIQTKEIELNQRDDKIKLQRQNQVLLYMGMFILLGLAAFAFRETIQKRKAIETLALQKRNLEDQKTKADKRTHDFTDSLNYAKRIQQAILRASLKLDDLFKESFIILFPRNIVSGDFFWVKERNNTILFALADCTGHGVPGALMSIIGTFGLNRFADEMEMTNPSEILTNLNTLFEESFQQQKGVEIFDGMDIALCSYNRNSKELIYAGANIPFYILRDSESPQPTRSIVKRGNTHTLYLVKPNKQPIGSYFEKKPFVNHSITLHENDTIYLFTDGFYDQFGGPEGRKYKSAQLFNLLCGVGTLPLENQKAILEKTFIEWKGERNQIDDVSFMGIKI